MGKYGLIYIAHNPRDGKDTFKVGKTERDIGGRMAELTASISNLGNYSPLASPCGIRFRGSAGLTSENVCVGSYPTRRDAAGQNF